MTIFVRRYTIEIVTRWLYQHIILHFSFLIIFKSAPKSAIQTLAVLFRNIFLSPPKCFFFTLHRRVYSIRTINAKKLPSKKHIVCRLPGIPKHVNVLHRNTSIHGPWSETRNCFSIVSFDLLVFEHNTTPCNQPVSPSLRTRVFSNKIVSNYNFLDNWLKICIPEIFSTFVYWLIY